jgi:PAS domain-containing protein
MHTLMHHTRKDGTPHPEEECPIYAAFRDGAMHHVETEIFWRKDGTSFPVNYTSSPLQDEHGTRLGAVVTFNDITEHQRMEDALREAHEEVEGRVQARTAELAHANEELRTEITERRQAEETLRKVHEELDARARELQERVNELERFHKATVQREFRIKELKSEIKRLKKPS